MVKKPSKGNYEWTLDKYAAIEWLGYPPLRIYELVTPEERGLFEFRNKTGASSPHKGLKIDGKKIELETIQRGGDSNLVEKIVACTVEKDDVMDCTTFDRTEDLFPDKKGVKLVKDDVDERDKAIFDDNDNYLFPELVSGHAPELKTIFYPDQYKKSSIESASRDAMNDYSMWKDSSGKRFNFRNDVLKGFMKRVDEMSDPSAASKDEFSEKDMKLVIDMAKVTKNLLDKETMKKLIEKERENERNMFNIFDQGSWSSCKATLQEKTRIFLYEMLFRKPRKDRTLSTKYDVEKEVTRDLINQISFKPVKSSILSILRKQSDLPVLGPIQLIEEKHDLFDNTRSIIVEQVMERVPYLTNLMEPDINEIFNPIRINLVKTRDTRSKVEHEKAVRYMEEMMGTYTLGRRDAFTLMFINDRGWVKRVKREAEAVAMRGFDEQS